MKRLLVFFSLILAGVILTSCDEIVSKSYKIQYDVLNEYVDLTPSEYSSKNTTNLPTYAKDGYVFIGWYTNNIFSGEQAEVIAAGSTGDKTFYGKVLKVNKLTLNFNGGTEVNYPKTFHEEESFDLPTTTTKQGYEFLGWYEDEAFSGNPLLKIPLQTKKDVILYARFEPSEHQLFLDFNGATPVDYPKSFYSNQEVILPSNIVKEGHIFVGWFNNPNFTGTSQTTIEIGTNSDQYFYACFQENVYLSLVLNGGSEVEYSELIDYYQDTVLPTTSTKENYLFGGWYFDKAFSGMPIEIIPKYHKSDLTLYARWLIDESIFEFLNIDEETLVTSNLNFVTNLKGFTIDYLSDKPEIIANSGILKRDYEETNVVINVSVTDGIETAEKDFSLTVAGYKSLDVPIKSGYIYRFHTWPNDYYFDNQEIVYTAFATADGSGNVLLDDYRNRNYFNNVTSLILPKAKEKGVRVIMSVGPSSEWSSFAATAELREEFVETIIVLINYYGFDGVDIDWETPVVSRNENLLFTLLMKEVYTQVKANNPFHLVTTAITGGNSQPPKYDLNNSRQYFDYINVMTYGMANNGGLYQNALYPSSSYHHPTFLVGRPPSKANIHDSISIFGNYGVHKSKLIIGVAFYGIKQFREYDESTNTYGSWKKFGSPDYYDINYIYLDYLQDDYTYYYDEVSGVPYIVKNDGLEFISYDDERSIQEKALYIIQNEIGGMMYWEYAHDYENSLLIAMCENMK